MPKDIVVIGGSAGGLEALKGIVPDLPRDLAASLFIVIHTSPESPGVLPEILQRFTSLPVLNASDQQRIELGQLYVAPPDHHLLVEPGVMRVTRGLRENRFRPAVDPLFRSAAQVYGPRVIGVILSGRLDDGTAGLWAVKRLGGTSIIQDPNEALYDSMPRHALDHVEIDYRVSVNKIGSLLANLTRQAEVAKGAYQV